MLNKVAPVALLAAGLTPIACQTTTPSAPKGADTEANEGSDDGASTGHDNPLAIGQQVPWPTDEWTVVAPEDMGMDAAVLEGAFDYAFGKGKNTQGVIVIRGGAIVAERYADGHDETSVAASWSAGKSFASTLVGIAIDEGLIDGVDAPMSTWIDSWAGSDKASITLEHVLHMESGLDFVEDYADIAESDVIAMGLRDDALGYASADVPVGSAPGSTWYYSSGDTMLLSGVVSAATGMGAHEYARTKLFDPIGMKTADWWRDGAGNALTFCCLDAPGREFAKFALLFLRGGDWDGTQVVSRQWVQEATTNRAANYDGYAYQWWTVDIDEDSPLPPDTYSARGLDSQNYYVIPSLDLVVIRNSLYEQKPGDKVAAGGYLRHFMPRGLYQYGTQAPNSWIDAEFLAPIINAIDGAEPIEVQSSAGEGGDDWGGEAGMVCQEIAKDYAGYCESVHGCACDLCPDEFLTCDADPACRTIMECALDNGCRGVACASTCETEIADNGGVFGGPAMAALALSDCVSTCPVDCDAE